MMRFQVNVRTKRTLNSFRKRLAVAVPLLALCACSHATQSTSLPATGNAVAGTARSTLGATATFQPTPIDPNLTVAPGFKAQIIARVPRARELLVAQNGDLLVGTENSTVAIVPNADSATDPGVAQTLVTLPEGPAAGIVFGPHNELYVGTEHAVWKLAYTPGQLSIAQHQQIAALRTGPVAPHSDGDIHHSTSVMYDQGRLYVSVGSSCNACTETDPGRAVILSMGLNGESPQVYAKRVRNAVAMAVAPHTAFLWAGGAGQDNLPTGHPHEYFDSITQHPAGSDWGWPDCEEKNVAYTPGADCSKTIVPHITLPAYATIIGATFYPHWIQGPYAFPARFRDGLFLTEHGSWHTDSHGAARVGPQVIFIPMNSNGWDAQTPVNWQDPTAQYSVFLGSFQVPGTTNFRGRPTGVRYSAKGSLFVADDLTGNIYRIRPQ